MRRCRIAMLVSLSLLGLACSESGGPADLIRATPAEATVNGRGADWFRAQAGKQLRIGDQVETVWPAAPPSRLRYAVTLPPKSVLSLSIAIPEERQDRPAVQFIVKLAQGSREQVVFDQTLEPATRPRDRRFVPASIDLAAFTGVATLTFETRDLGETHDPEDARRAYWGAPAVSQASRQAPLVVVYLVDTLRADHTTPYGYTRDTTPELQRFATRATLFENAIAQASWTKPSVASLFTSLPPGQHRAVQLRDTLDPEHFTLAELLRAKGYATTAAIANSVIYSKGGNFEQGFDLFSGLHGAADKPSKLVEAGVVVDEALRLLDTRRGLPTFLYVHTMDPHVPYAPPAPFDRRYEPYATPEHPAVDPRTDFKEPLDRERLIARYDGDVAYWDQEFGRFLRGLEERGVLRQALIVFLADHGEEFQDHGGWLHGRSVFDELVRVPLIVKFPSDRDGGRRIPQQVRLVDVLPTILAEQGLPVPLPPAILGQPLQAVVAGQLAEQAAPSEISHRGFVAYGLRSGQAKYIERFSPQPDELYFDLAQDPGERTNRLAAHRDKVRTLRTRVQAGMVPNPFRDALRFVGGSRYELLLETRGWIEGLETGGFGAGDTAQLTQDRKQLRIGISAKVDLRRELSFAVRPIGAPVRLSGSRDGQPLRPRDVLMAEQGISPAAVPFDLPEIETEAERVENMLAAPARSTALGLHVWLQPLPGRTLLAFDAEARERLKALGYINN